MSFKLENIKIEGEGKQEIIGKYDVPGFNNIQEDRTFCLTNCGSDCPDFNCDYNKDNCTYYCDCHEEVRIRGEGRCWAYSDPCRDNEGCHCNGD